MTPPLLAWRKIVLPGEVALKSSSKQLAIGWGFLLILAMAYGDFAMPKWRDQTLYVEALFPAERSGASREGSSHEAGPHEASAQERTITRSTPERVLADPLSLGYPPLYSIFFKQLSTLRPSISLLIWQFASLLVLAYGVFLLGAGASKMDAQGSEMADEGWFAFAFLPFVLAIWNGTGNVIFGLFPAMLGYFAVVAKKEFLGGFVLALCFVDSCLLVPASVMSCALLARGKPRCLIGLLVGLAFFMGVNYWFAPAAFTQWLQANLPATIVQFDPSVKLPWFVANLPQAVTMIIPLEKQPGLIQLVWLGACAIVLIVVYQVLQLVRKTKENFNVAPLSFVTGIYLIPLVVPGLRYLDLTCLLLLGLIVFSLEWRQATDWRLKTLVRVSAIAINAYGALVYFAAPIAYPVILGVCLLVLFRRLIEAIHLAAQEHEGLVRPVDID